MRDERSLVARRIEEVRKVKKLSRQQLADLLNAAERKLPVQDRRKWTYLSVYRIEHDIVEITAATATKVAAVLDVSAASLLRESRAAS